MLEFEDGEMLPQTPAIAFYLASEFGKSIDYLPVPVVRTYIPISQLSILFTFHKIV